MAEGRKIRSLIQYIRDGRGEPDWSPELQRPSVRLREDDIR